ncbi:hypothetical protein ACOMHN_010186 [Nucella lapillus]
MASATSSSSLSAPGVRKVTFAPSATVYLFDRQVMLDRWPRDGETFGLGMQTNHFLTEEHPLEDPEVHPRGKLRPVEFQDRLHLLQSYLSSMTARLRSALHGEVGEWKKLFHSMKQSGSCRGACDPSTCECLLAGVSCHQTRLRFSRQPCSCRFDLCPSSYHSVTPVQKKRRKREHAIRMLKTMSVEE